MTHLSPFEGLNLNLLLEDRARQRPDHPFLVWAPFEGPSHSWTYREFATDVARLAGGLANRGIGPGDRVLVHFENCPETLLARFALARLGAICVATNAMAAGPEITHYAGSSRATAAITQGKFAELVASHAPDVKWIAVADGAGSNASHGPDSFNALFAETAPAHPTLHSDPASIMFTTGTTGKPKGVVWTQANLLWACKYGAQVYGHRNEDVSLISLPLFHVVGLCWSFLPVLWAGGTAVLQPRFSASRFWPASLEHRATLASQVLFTSMALQQQPVPERHFYRQWTVARGDSASQSYNRIASFVPSWGMTEMIAPTIHGDPLIRAAEGALGRPSLAHQVRVRHADGRPVKPGETGELTVKGVRGLSVFLEYDGNPDATRAAFDEEGFFGTGDRVTLLDAGWIRFSERASDIIKVGGEGVSPAEIETVVRGVNGVREVAVVGVQDDSYGQVPVAFVEADGGSGGELEASILASCRGALAKFKVPRRVVILAELPRVGNAKIARTKLRQMIESETKSRGSETQCSERNTGP
jgi:crotonobetaine/carnitine-CoA ligase